MTEEIEKKSQLSVGTQNHPDNCRCICPPLVLSLFCSSLCLLGSRFLLNLQLRFLSKDKTGSSEASSARLCSSFGDIDESLSPTLRVYGIRRIALRGTGSLTGWVICPQNKL